MTIVLPLAHSVENSMSADRVASLRLTAAGPFLRSTRRYRMKLTTTGAERIRLPVAPGNRRKNQMPAQTPAQTPAPAHWTSAADHSINDYPK